MPNELKDLKVEFISIVKSPANGKRLILKGYEPHYFQVITKDELLKRVYGIVYAPDDTDAQDDFANAPTIRKAADDFLANARIGNIDTNHDFLPKGAFVAESWLVRKGDPLFPDEHPGAWAVGIQITDDSLWKGLESGEYTGLSLAGTAARVPQKKNEDEIPGWFRKIFKREEKGMDEETKKLIGELKSMISGLSAKLTGKEPDKGGGDGEDVKKEIGELKTLIGKMKEDGEKRTADLKAELEKSASDEMKKLLAEAMRKGTDATAGQTPGIEAEMV